MEPEKHGQTRQTADIREGMKVYLYGALWMAMAFCGCRHPFFSGTDSSLLSPTVDLFISFNPLPVHPSIPVPSDGRWRIQWFDPDGNLRETFCGNKGTVIVLRRGQTTPVTAVHTGGITHSIHPRGAFYPQEAYIKAGKNILHLDSAGGILAEEARVAIDSARASSREVLLLVSIFNWKRARDRLATLKAPWQLDRDRFRTAFLSGRMSVHDIRELPSVVVNLSAVTHGTIPPGAYVHPFDGRAIMYSGNGEPFEAELSAGFHRLFTQEGYLSIQMAANKSECVFFIPYSLQDRHGSDTVE